MNIPLKDELDAVVKKHVTNIVDEVAHLVQTRLMQDIRTHFGLPVVPKVVKPATPKRALQVSTKALPDRPAPKTTKVSKVVSITSSHNYRPNKK